MKQSLLRSIPKIDDLLMHPIIEERLHLIPRDLVVAIIREVIQETREHILALDAAALESMTALNTEGLVLKIRDQIDEEAAFSLKRVINTTGVVLHTNLGRSLLPKSMMGHLSDVATGYSTLEFDIHNGKRGSRYSHVEKLLCRITGAEAALVVNNNAAAVLLALSTAANGKEVVVSRGELVEIGGAFRIPEVMKQSGACLIEVGATNKTHLRDYEQVIHEGTGAVLKVHTSNYRILGFTQEVESQAICELCHEKGVLVMEDIGSGSLIDLSKYGLTKEPTVIEALKAGMDVVMFSGDKMLGGPQAGILVGKKHWIEKMKKNQLTRALRVDKLTLSVLEATLKLYLDEETAIKEIPTLRMLTLSKQSIQKEAEALCQALSQISDLESGMIEGESEVGGGSLPLEKLPTWLVWVKPKKRSVSSAVEALRKLPVPVIVRVESDQILIDPRTLQAGELEEVASALAIISVV